MRLRIGGEEVIHVIAAAWSVLSDKLKAAIFAIGGFLIGAVLVWLTLTFVYEGLKLPLVGQVIDGRVQHAVRAATANLVASADLTAANTRAALAEAQLERITTMAEKTSTWSAAEDARAAADQATLETDNAVKPTSCADGDSPVWNDADDQWLRQRRSSAH